MPKLSDGRPQLVLALAAALCGCRETPVAETRSGYGSASPAAGALVKAPQGDTSEDIVSWVDGQVVRDWPAEVAKRDKAIEAYVDDSDPERAQQYGFRSGQNPRLAWAWFRDNPVGF